MDENGHPCTGKPKRSHPKLATCTHRHVGLAVFPYLIYTTSLTHIPTHEAEDAPEIIFSLGIPSTDTIPSIELESRDQHGQRYGCESGLGFGVDHESAGGGQ